MIEYIRRRQKEWQKKWNHEADLEDEREAIREAERQLEAEREAEREAVRAAEARRREEIAEHKKLLQEQQQAERLRQKRAQEKQKLIEESWGKQIDTLLAQMEVDQRQEDKLQEIQIIIQNREPYLGVLNWRTWLSNPLNQRLAELDFEYAVQMFRRDNRMARLRPRTSGKKRAEINYALSFSGDRAGATDSYATTTFNPDTYSLWNGFTISFWVRPDEAMNQTSVILGSRANSPTARFHFGVHSNGNINVGIGGSNVTGINNPMEVGQWYNWVISYTGDDKGFGERKVRMWINNDPRMTSNTNSRWANQDEDMTIYFGGRNTEGSGYTNGFACALTNIAIYNVCKDSDGTFANEVYNNGIKHNYEGSDDLVGYWRFTEGSGATIADTSGNGNNATFGAISGDTTAHPIWETVE